MIYYQINEKGEVVRSDGKTPSESEVEYALSVNVPPSYSDVRIYKQPNRLFFTALDSGGKRQYLYTEEWNKKAENLKFKGVKSLANDYEKLRKLLVKNLGSESLTKRDTASILLIIMECGLRIGEDRYEKQNESFGVSTIKKKHVCIEKETVKLEFVGKKGVINYCAFKNKKIRDYLQQKIDGIKKEDRVFEVHPVTVNRFLRTLGPYRAKTIRTLKANILFLKNLRRGVEKNGDYKKSELKKIVNTALDETAFTLNNTKSVCKKKYIYSQFINEFLEQFELFRKKLFKYNDLDFLKKFLP